MLPKCSICDGHVRGFIMNNRHVCLRCDELTFDLEIECDEEPRHDAKLFSKLEGSTPLETEVSKK